MNAMTHPRGLSGNAHPARPRQKRPRLFRGLTAPQMAMTRQAFSQDLFHHGEPVPRQEVGTPHVGIVLRGALREDIVEADGISRLFGLTFAGEVLSPLGPRTTGARLSAQDETTMLLCEAEAFSELLHEIPRLRMNYLEELQDRLAEARRWQVLLGRKTAAERVATMLFWFWDRQDRPVELDLRLKRSEIGELLGLTFETVSRQVKALEQSGTIELPQPTCVRIRDPQGLYVLSGEAPAHRRAA